MSLASSHWLLGNGMLTWISWEPDDYPLSVLHSQANQDGWVANANVVALGKFEALLQVLPSEVYKISNRKEGKMGGG